MLVHRLHNHVIDPQKYPMLKTQVQAAQFLVSRVVGRAENPRQVHVEGQLTLTQLIAEAAGVPLDRAEPVAPTVN